jgi:hypothetical protein
MVDAKAAAADQGEESGPAIADPLGAAAHVTTPVAGRVERVKVRLSQLHTCDEELLEVIERATTRRDAVLERATAGRDAALAQARAERDAAIARARAECDAIVRRATEECDELIAQETAEHAAVTEPAMAEREAVRAEMASAEKLLNVLVNAPVSGRRDPFEWLPDELIVMILLMLPFDVLWGKVCERVCERWARLMESALVKRCKRDGRWAAYEARLIKPRVIVGHDEDVLSLTVGLDGKIYSGSEDTTIRVWSGADGTHLRTLQGHTRCVWALAVHTKKVWKPTAGLVYV